MRRVLLLTSALLLAACGGGEDAKAAYVSDASAVCDEAAAESKALKRPAAPADFAPYADGLVRIAKQAQADLAELTPPEEDEADLRSKVLEPFADVVLEGEAFAKKVRAAGADQAKLLPLLGQVPDAGEVDLEYLRDYGLDSCADVISQTG
jgi:hypothetical protein